MYLSHRLTIDALGAYLTYRIERVWLMGPTPDRYRDLMPNSELILTLKGQKFYLNNKRRMNEAGVQVDYHAGGGLQAHITRLYKDAGIKGGSSHSGRRSFASNLLAKGTDVETVQQLLGHA